ncbi:MAG: protein kinase [Verrucomicrobium sp.]
MNLNNNIQRTTGLQLAPLPEQGGPQTEVVHPSIAARVKGKALTLESMAPLRDRGIESDQIISRAGIKALLKKTPEEMSSRRLSNFLSIFPGKLGRSEWTGSSHLQDIKRLADAYQNLPAHAPQEKLEVLQRLSHALDSYGSESAKARLGDRIAGLKEFVRGEMLNLRAQMQEPGLHDLGADVYGPKGILAETYAPFLLAVEMGDQEALDGIVTDMTHRLVVDLRHREVDGEKFAGSSGTRLKEQLRDVILGTQPRSSEVMNGSEHAWTMVDKALDRLYAGVVNGLNEGHGAMRTDGSLMVGESHYVPQGGVGAKDVPVAAGGASLGEGGYGSVYIYDGPDGSKVVVKEPLYEGEDEMVGDQRLGKLQEKARESHREAEMHSQAQGGAGHENLVRLEGTVHNGKNTTICLEYCPNGDVPGMGRKLWDREMLPGLSPDQQSRARQLAVGLMLRDMARGLDHIHKNGVGHMDFKGVNVFLGSDGLAKVGDLGTGVKMQDGLYHVPMTHQYVDSPSYVAPELLELAELPPTKSYMRALPDKEWILSHDLGRYEAAYEAFSDPAPLEEFRRVKDTLLGIQERARQEGSDKDELVAQWRQAVTGLETMVKGLKQVPGLTTGQVVDVNKADVWALGVTLCELAYPSEGGGASPFEGSSSKRTATNIREYGQDGTKTFTQLRLERWEQEHPGVLPPTDDRLDALLDKMLDPDPQKRISSAELLQDPFFQDEALDDPQVREFIRKLTSPGSSRVEIEESAKLVAKL